MSRYWLLSLRLSTLLAVSFSCALLLHYLSPVDHAFCGAASDCEVVRKSPLATLGPRGSLPGLGVAGYLGLFWLTFQPNLRRFIMPGAALGAGLAIALLAYQAFVLHAFCWLCVTVEAMALLVVGSTYLLRHTLDSAGHQQWDSLRGWAWFALLALSINAPNVWVQVRARETLPAAIQELQQPDVVTIVEFADFECPHCRRMHGSLTTALAVAPKPFHLVRFHMPLKFHIYAEGAARAAICADTFDRGEAMANRLFSGHLEPTALFEHAAALGIPEAPFRTCMEAESTRAILAEHRALFDKLGGAGVPLTFIGEEKLEGATSPNVIAQAIDKASKPPKFRGLSPLMFAATLLVTVIVVFIVGRQRQTH